MKSILIISGILLFASLNTMAASITIGPHQPIRSIRAGIATAAAGDTLWIEAGTYREGNMVLDKSLVLLGKGFPVLDGENKFEILTIKANGVVIKGLKFINTGVASMNDLAAVKAIGCANLRITDNRFENTFFGIYFANTSQSWIEGNQLQADAEAEHQIGNGIHMWKCSHITVNGNTIKGHRDGIYFEFVTNSLITRNHSEGNLRYGLHFMFSHNDEYRNNTFVNNGAGVAVMYSKGVKMIENVFEYNWGSAAYGLLLKDIRDSFVSSNTFRKNSVGIFMEGSSRIQFQENTFMNNGYAVRLQASCDDNVFERNNFLANTFDVVTNGTLVLNKINSNYWDKYEGYDLNKDSTGDIPYRPVSLYGMMVEQMPTAVLLWRSFLVYLMDRTEKAIPAITPENLKDELPSMRPYDIISQRQ
ncbi:nitrous oxidase accessory protein [Chryseolinea serpens]|uniref:Nitrous oxidase accessory protein n=1 Tax=Chryseolinea serpens TaxID=947013 RepID=A0A1M5QSM5_9BACT|nr:nitrous oxide reductase family maturation protein NosD [Chryseolinea serpens]SHH16901.1 nitrous oxidase accessory protein [Chryseolinea serpens]